MKIPGQIKGIDVHNCINWALGIGYRHLDCAAVYENEEAIGFALFDAMKTYNLSREDIFVTSKLWNTEHSANRVIPACQKTLRVVFFHFVKQDLKLDYLDLYLIHWPVAFQKVEKSAAWTPRDDDDNIIYEDVSIKETWEAMEQLVDMGLVKNIGVSNFTIAMLEDLLKYAKVKPYTNQIESHPYLPQWDILDFCNSRGILILKVADAEGISPSQVLLSWAIQRGTIVIPKTIHKGRLEENMNVKKLSESSMNIINSIKIRHRFINPEWAKFGDE
ncbi:Aldo/keto reductase [Rozella allomycis CSF55]|uniref:Aldo/keto reductase n=1 Tax=Rozella allomycis (strain CSF55) TaxID=988480 RepID=A0A4P9YHJ9_ROZAC|nr:Aldo/keto reductase [Rozella allomycis CSF55]